MKKKLLIALLLLGLGLPLHAATYKVDPDHSSVMFRVRHLLGKVTGRFDKYEATFDYDPNNLKAFKASATIEAASINTNVERRDNHLRSPDFFDVNKYPALTFVSKKISDINGTKAKLTGDLTMHGVTKSVTLDVEFMGTIKDPMGHERAAVTGTTTVKRADYGLTWNKVMETGGMLVGEDVEIILEIEGIKI